jgi:serine/threonine-protein kinase/endoribonuclease IRE1
VLTCSSFDAANAAQELAALIASDAHPSVLRCFAMEEDVNFIYVALERCVCTLADLFGARAARAHAARR